MEDIKSIAMIYLAAVNIFAFALYGIDKKRAELHQWRIPEARLLLSAFIGGAAGAFFGMTTFHHKTRKWKFRVLVPAALVLWVMIVMALFR